MPALNFHAQFAPLVESGAKRQTIRAYRKDGRDPKVGDKLFLFAGMRTLACRRLAIRSDVDVRIILVEDRPPRHVVRCRSVRVVHLSRTKVRLDVQVDYRWLSDYADPSRAIRDFARRDGFLSVRAMFDWFEKTHGLPFRGLLIRW